MPQLKSLLSWLLIPAILILLLYGVQDAYLLTHRSPVSLVRPAIIPENWYCGRLFNRSQCVLMDDADRSHLVMLGIALRWFFVPVIGLNLLVNRGLAIGQPREGS